MKKAPIRIIFTRILTWILLIQIVNISIDSTDALPIIDSLGLLTAHEDLSVNDIESIYEFVSESCLGVDVPEQDEDDENGFVKVMDFYFTGAYITIKPKYIEKDLHVTSMIHGTFSVLLEHISPPPRTA